MLNIPLMQNNIAKEDIDSLIKFLKDSDRFTNGSKVREFEEEWSKWLGVKYSIMVNSGSSANYITMAVVKELYGGGEVLVPMIAWESDVASVIAAGLTPVFVDLDFKNMAMAHNKILEAITDNTVAVFITHVLGFNALDEEIIEELSKRNIKLIEDVCESHGTTMNGKKAGALGYASNFSFYYAHHMSTIEGGMICTNDKMFYSFCRMFRSHGMLRECDNEELNQKYCEEYPDVHPEFLFPVMGFNMRSTEINAVLGLSALKRLDSNIEKRRDNFEFFIEHLDSEKYYTDFDLKGNSNYAFVIILRSKYKSKFDDLCNKLKKEKVEFRRGTAGGGNMTRQPYIRKRYPNIKPEAYPNAEYIHFYGIYSGNYPSLGKDKILGLCKVLNEI